MISVYIISLKDSKRRLDTEKLVLESNEKFRGHCVFHIFDAISPKHEDFEKLVKELYDASSLLQSDWFCSSVGNGLSLPELGCYLSHYFLWEECAKLNQPVIVLEDDVALESNFIQALEDCLKSPFDFVRLYGDYWYFHSTDFNTLFTQTANTEKNFKYYIKSRLKNLFKSIPLSQIIIRIPTKTAELFQRKYFSKREKEALFLEHFYLTSVYVATTAGYYLTPKGAKTFIDATKKFKIIEPVDMFMDNPTYHDVASLTYVPCALSLNGHSFNSTIQSQHQGNKKENKKRYKIVLPTPPRKAYLKRLFSYATNAKKRLKAFQQFYEKYAHLESHT
ncbi:glycosyltransferase family 25 protein [Helicobacter cetorum]|uniref:Lipopolysaccharide biosynthesis protein n=1 Tax=Helicobacter cetorum (strain ATCC BAA-540 / CCUG 52418 / MIT 99-5656) TaxID=1163745 RepID=I0ET01_HELCM|nr:glycosyltransferase family 25 protein [Helicobacter cetorum]AFI06070.1 lipopolysaccharide biosynthesis protein [Helicobacter cetorum MIT 99-5656]